jgi:hypothetical protein
MRRLLFIPVLLWCAFACTPEIGDPCASNLECQERAICDTTVQNGYCAIFDCSGTDDCPDGSVCVTFRTFAACMLHCRSDGDCRLEDGHVCRTDLSPGAFCYHPEQEP